MSVGEDDEGTEWDGKRVGAVATAMNSVTKGKLIFFT